MSFFYFCDLAPCGCTEKSASTHVFISVRDVVTSWNQCQQILKVPDVKRWDGAHQ